MSGFLDDLDVMVLSTCVVLSVLALAEFARRRGVERSTTRKIVHVGIGTWVLPTFLLFEHRLWAVVPPACFVLVNAISYRTGLIRSVEGGEKNLGTILYPISVATALGVFWNEPWPVVGASAILVMAWGDAAGSLVGRRFGRRRFHVAGHVRTLEGSAAVFVGSVLAILVSYAVMGRAIDPAILGAAVFAALVATGLEAVSLWGFDNVLVPAGVAWVLWSLYGSWWT